MLHHIGALDDVIDGRLVEWVDKARHRWAILPNSSLQVGGTKVAMAQVEDAWKRYGGSTPVIIDMSASDRPDPAPVEDRSTQALPEDVARINTEEPMAAPLLIPILTVMGQLIPTIAALFGKDGEKAATKIGAATKAIEIVTTAVGGMNAQDAVEKISADPVRLAPLATAAITADPVIGMMLTEVSGGGIDVARKVAGDPSMSPFWMQGAFWMAIKEAVDQGAHDALILNTENQIAECAVSNLFIVEGNTVITPSLKANLLPGVTRRIILEFCKENRIHASEELFGLEWVLAAGEVFLTNSLMEVMPVSMINKQPIGRLVPGIITTLLHDKYKALTP